MFTRNRSFEFDSLAGRFVISREGPVNAIDRDRAADMINDRARQDRGFRSALARWAIDESLVSGLGDELKTVDNLIRAVRLGMLRVHEKSVTRPAYTHRFPDSWAQPEHESVPFAGNVIDETAETGRSLLITHCPPQFDPHAEPLRILYLLRDLDGRPVELVIRSQASPEPPVHRRMLTPAETSDGPGKLEWDGKRDATGEFVERGDAPLVVELIHDEALRDQAPTTLPPAALVHVVEVEDLMFATDRAIFMPDGGVMPDGGADESVDESAEDDQSRATGLHAIAAVLRHAAFYRSKQLCVFGHTDTVGRDADNLQLSSDRATNIHHVVAGDADAWADHCGHNYEVADFQRVLKWIAQTKGWPTDPGPIDNDFGDASRSARYNFRALMNEHYGTDLKQGVKQNVADWKAYFTLFNEELCRILLASPADLERIRDELQFTSVATVGCGEAFPAAQPELNNFESAANRRVDIVFFEPDEIPDLPGDPPGAPLYSSKDYEARYIPVGEGGGKVPVLLRLLDGGQFLGGTQYLIEHGDELLDSGSTKANGTILVDLPRDIPDLVLRVPSLGRIFMLDVATLLPLPELTGAQARLTNLGYTCPISGALDEETRNALMAFQGDHDHDITGELDRATMDALRYVHDL